MLAGREQPDLDKDDDLTVDFVTAAANLRAACYGIPQQKR
jgi:ubiquitin-like 1-activating enzyme E1 B